MKQSKQIARSLLIITLTLTAACSDPASHTPNVTLETIAGRYQLESVGGKQLPVAQGFCTIEWCGVVSTVTGGYLEIGMAGSDSWTRVITTRSDFPPYDHSTTRSGKLSVDYYGRLTLNVASAEPQTWDGAFADGIVTISEFGPYRYRRIE